MILDDLQAAAHHLAEDPSPSEPPAPGGWKGPKRLAPPQYFNFPALRAEAETGRCPPTV